ncbi:MAG: mannose-6-phosphate isomerase [Thermomicrobiales bacterium]|nr:MAG: mannose-6-phosphate isomerase [Thermomicrobiales bacterium]
MPSILAHTSAPIRVAPQLRERVWGGKRLRSEGPPVGEAWVIHTDSEIVGGPGSGKTLGALAHAWGESLVGHHVLRRHGATIPLLIKLIDAAEWLSVQVHPDDHTAQELEGSGHVGKTEAWYVLAAEEHTEIIAGMREHVGAAELADAIVAGTILDHVERLPVRPGQTVFIPAGTIHALGPGILVYEVQQNSDLTYRVYDWGRPASAGRELHLRQAVAAANPAARPRSPEPVRRSQTQETLVSCPYFCLERVTIGPAGTTLQTRGESFHALTVIEGTMTIRTAGGEARASAYESLVIPACTGAYLLTAAGTSRARALVAWVPEGDGS